MRIKNKEDKALLLKLGAHLRKIRNNKRWTLEHTEEHGWSDCQYLQKIESGKKDIGLLTLKRLSRLYKIKMSDIIKNL